MGRRSMYHLNFKTAKRRMVDQKGNPLTGTTIRRTVCAGDGKTTLPTNTGFSAPPTAHKNGCYYVSVVVPGVHPGVPGASKAIFHGNWTQSLLLWPLFSVALAGSCVDASKRPKTIVDLGADVGEYSLFFATKGCNTLAVEANPRFANMIVTGRVENGLPLSRLRVQRATVGVKGTIAIVNRRNVSGASWFRVQSDTQTMDSILASLHTRVSLMRMDLKNATVAALCSGITTLRNGKVERIAMSYDWSQISNVQATSADSLLRSSGFKLDTRQVHTSWSLEQFYRRSSNVGYLVLYTWSGRSSVGVSPLCTK
jgi:hypothetical protein